MITLMQPKPVKELKQVIKTELNNNVPWQHWIDNHQFYINYNGLIFADGRIAEKIVEIAQQNGIEGFLDGKYQIRLAKAKHSEENLAVLTRQTDATNIIVFSNVESTVTMDVKWSKESKLYIHYPVFGRPYNIIKPKYTIHKQTAKMNYELVWEKFPKQSTNIDWLPSDHFCQEFENDLEQIIKELKQAYS